MCVEINVDKRQLREMQPRLNPGFAVNTSVLPGIDSEPHFAIASYCVIDISLVFFLFDLSANIMVEIILKVCRVYE